MSLAAEVAPWIPLRCIQATISQGRTAYGVVVGWSETPPDALIEVAELALRPTPERPFSILRPSWVGNAKRLALLVLL